MHADDNETGEERPLDLRPSLHVKDTLNHTSTPPVYPAES